MKRPQWWLNIQQRWTNTMPKFFKWVFGVFSFIGGLAVAINEGLEVSHAQPHQWWIDVYPYLIGSSFGAAFVAKFTQTYGKDGKPIEKNKSEESSNTILDSDNF